MKFSAKTGNLRHLAAHCARWLFLALTALAAASWCIMTNPRDTRTPAAGRAATAEKEHIEAQMLALSGTRERLTTSYGDILSKKTAAQIGYDNACLAKEKGQFVERDLISARMLLAIRRIQSENGRRPTGSHQRTSQVLDRCVHTVMRSAAHAARAYRGRPGHRHPRWWALAFAEVIMP